MNIDFTTPTPTLAHIEEAIQQSAAQYFRLVILAGLPGSGKTAALQAVGRRLGCQVVNVNLELSKRMLELTRTQYNGPQFLDHAIS
jgi:predicted ATPase